MQTVKAPKAKELLNAIIEEQRIKVERCLRYILKILSG
jgi:hypothetical protein